MFKNLAAKVTDNFDGFEIAIIGIIVAIFAVGIFAICHSKPLECSNGQTVHSTVRVVPVVVSNGKTTTVTTSTQVFEYCA
jgi:hypothetical protein